MEITARYSLNSSADDRCRSVAHKSPALAFGWGWRGGGWGWGGAAVGLAAGALIGGAIAASSYGY
ncbi:MAG: hypothetical protein WCD69_25175, partial [Xanthobacteraceae bacterium]